MSTAVQSIQPRARLAVVPFLVAILLALAIGATAGSLVTRTVVARSHPVENATGWDAQKLAAMEGRQLAVVVGGRIKPWDPEKLRAMAGRERAEAINLNGASG
jgi:hypothetical protein